MPPRNPSGYIRDVDQLIESTPLDSVLLHYGQPTPEKTNGEHRLGCVFTESCADSTYGELTVKIDDPVHRIYCHSCGVRGNILTLIHGFEQHQPPATGRLKGQEFKDAVAKLREIAGNEAPSLAPSAAVAQPSHGPSENSDTKNEEPPTNTPLTRHEKEAARAFADLYNDLVVDPADMRPEAGEYVRSRKWMTPELMQKWGVGWIPGNGRSLFRKNYLVYTHRNERGEVVSYSGRDLLFESKWQQWIKDGRPASKKPNKHRYVQGFHRGVELYGGHAERLNEPYVRESLDKLGVVVVEGMNEVLRCEAAGIAAVALTSNKATEHQINTLTRFARRAGGNRVVLLPDCDDEGEAGFRDLMWQLAQQQVQVRLGCARASHGGRFAGRQPEDFSDDEMAIISSSLGAGR